MELKAVRLIQRSKPLSNSKTLHFKVSVWNSTIKSSAFFFLTTDEICIPQSNTFSYYLSWMYNVRIDFLRVQCWASGGWGGANGNSKCERSRNSKGRNSECLLLILVPSISTNKQTKTYLSLLLILKPINGSLLSRVYSPNFWAGYLNAICADSCLPL